jgi:hypothetical protein
VNHVAIIQPTPVPVLVRNAFAHMARRADDLPGWCDHTDPVARALQAALGFRLALEQIAKEDERAAMALRLVDDDYFEDDERRLRYLPRRLITQDDIDAARLTVARAVTVLALAVIRKKRWRAPIGEDAFLTDWTIIKRVLAESAPSHFDSWGQPNQWDHPSFRDLAREYGLDKSGNGIGRRFRAAIKAIAKVLGPVEWPQSLSPHHLPHYRAGVRPAWHHKIHVHQDTQAGWYPPDFQSREQVLATELELVARFVANGGTVQKLPPGLAVDFDEHDGHIAGKLCAAYGAEGELLWVVSSRPQPAWDNVPGGPRYPDIDLFGASKWEGKMHATFAKAYRRGLQ